MAKKQYFMIQSNLLRPHNSVVLRFMWIPILLACRQGHRERYFFRKDIAPLVVPRTFLWLIIILKSQNDLQQWVTENKEEYWNVILVKIVRKISYRD